MREGKKYEPTRNNDHLNVHSAYLLTMWRANVDCQLVASPRAMLKYCKIRFKGWKKI